MFITKTVTKNDTIYYLSKSFRDVETGKSHTKIVERLGTEKELQLKIGKDKDLQKYLKDYAIERTEEDKVNKSINIKIKSNSRIKKEDNIQLNIGYLFLQKTCYELGLNRILNAIARREKLNFNFTAIIISLICVKLLYTANSTNSYELMQLQADNIDFSEKDIYKAIKVFVKYDAYIQKELFKKVSKFMSCKNDKLFYSCHNYSLITTNIEIARDDNYVNNDILLLKLYFDSNGIPRAYLIENNSECIDEQLDAVNKYLSKSYKDATLFTIPNSIATPSDSENFKNFKYFKRVPLYEINSEKDSFWKWALDYKEWRTIRTNRKVDTRNVEYDIYTRQLRQSDREKYYADSYYKTKKLKGKNLFVAFNYDLLDWNYLFRNMQINNFQYSIESRIGKYSEKALDKMSNKYNKMLQKVNFENEYTKKSYNLYYFNDKALRVNQELDGYFVMWENISIKDLKQITNVWLTKNFQMDYLISYLSSECIANTLIDTNEAIHAHYLMSFVSLLIMKLFEYKLGNKFWNQQLIDRLLTMNLQMIDDEISLPIYNMDKVSRALQNSFGIEIDYKYFDKTRLDSIIRASKNIKSE